MHNFSSKWSKQPQSGITEKINDSIKPKGPLKPRIQTAVKKLQLQIQKLDSMLTNLQERDAKLFQRIVEATHLDKRHQWIRLGSGRVLGSR